MERMTSSRVSGAALRGSFAAPGEPRDVSVDLSNGQPWVAARVAHTVYRFSPGGTRLAQVGGLGDVYEVKLDPGTP